MVDDSQKTTKDKINEFEKKSQNIRMMGGEKQVNKQHEGGKLTARERLDFLFDKGTFEEIQLFVKHRSTLFGFDKRIFLQTASLRAWQINSRVIFAAAQDFTSSGGSLGEMHAKI